MFGSQLSPITSQFNSPFAGGLQQWQPGAIAQQLGYQPGQLIQQVVAQTAQQVVPLIVQQCTQVVAQTIAQNVSRVVQEIVTQEVSRQQGQQQYSPLLGAQQGYGAQQGLMTSPLPFLGALCGKSVSRARPSRSKALALVSKEAWGRYPLRSSTRN